MSALKFYPVFLDNIAASVQASDLRALFSRVGLVIDVIVVSDHGFVNMESAREAEAAIRGLNGTPLHNQLLHVDFSEELKQFFDDNREPFRITVDPQTGVTKYRHPRYPSGPKVQSPFYESVREDVSHLADDREAIENRLRRINAELHALEDDGYHHRRERSRSRTRETAREVRRSREKRRSRSPISDRQRSRRERTPDIREKYEIFVGGLNNPVREDALASIYKRFGHVLEINCIKNFAFVNLLCEEHEAIAAVSMTTGIMEFGNKLNVNFKKGSKHDDLNKRIKAGPLLCPQPDLLRLQPGRDLSAQAFKSNVMEPRSEPLLPAPVPAFSSSAPGPYMSQMSQPFDENLIEQFVKSTRQNSEFLVDWGQKSADADITGGGGYDQYFDGYSIAPSSSKPAVPAETAARAEVEEIFTAAPSTATSASTSLVSGYQTPSSADLLSILATIQKKTDPVTSKSTSVVTNPSVPDPPVSEGPKAQRKIHVSGLNTRVNDFDLKDMFSQYGQINRVDSKGNYAYVLLFSTELAVVRCVCELDARIFKGTKMRVSFMRGSFEDTQEFKDKYAEQIKQFTSSEHKRTLWRSVDINQPPKVKLSQIGEGLKNIDMSLNLAPVDSSFQGYQQAQQYPESFYQQTGSFQPTPKETRHLYDISGTIHSIQSKIVILEFTIPCSGIITMAKIIPGQMYINGHTSLGLAIKSNTSNTWPKMVKDFMQIGKKIMMNLRKLSGKEMHEQKDKERSIQWVAPLVWEEGPRVEEEDQLVTEDRMESRVEVGEVTRLCPKGGFLRTQSGDNVVFSAGSLFTDQAILADTDSLFNRTEIEVGDILAVHHVAVTYNKARDLVSRMPGFKRQMSASVSRSALLVWPMTAEVDPWVYYTRPVPDTVRFLSTSSSLARQLPGEKEAEHFNVSGVITTLQLPAGGEARLDGTAAAQLGGALVYFHRSRLIINGVKIQSDSRLDEALVPGDRVSMDLIRNPEEQPYIASEAGWVALTVRVHTVVRGKRIAEDMRCQVGDTDMLEARVVWLQPPVEATGPVISGMAVVDSGQFLGQRVEFDRGVTSAWGRSLNRADLGQLLSYGERVRLRLKPYNSYCVDSLVVCEAREGKRISLQAWLEDKKITSSEFDQLLRGHTKPRRHLPLISQIVEGQVTSVVRDDLGFVTGVRLLTQCGREVNADRSLIYVYCHWMGKADLSYCLASGEPLFVVLPPRYVSSVSVASGSAASLAWVGGPDHAPLYPGASATVSLTDTTSTHLKLWLQTKRMELGIFRTLVEGRLPSKRSIVEVVAKYQGLNATQAQAAIIRDFKAMKMMFDTEKMVLSLVTLLRSEMETPMHEVNIPGLSQAPTPPPPGDSSPSTLTSSHQNRSELALSSHPLLNAMPSSISSKFYYSSKSVTASYSSGPKPPISNVAPSKPQDYQGCQAHPPPPPPPKTESSQYYQMYYQRH